MLDLLRVKINDWLEQSGSLAQMIPLSLAFAVGVLTGLCVVLFILTVSVFSEAAAWLRGEGGMVAMFAMLIGGGLLSGWFIQKYAPEASGSGIPEVIEAVALHRGFIRSLIIPLKFITSIITIVVGGSAGREGPIVQIGSALGSIQGRWLRLPEEHIRVLVASGAAAGISAAFNAPIAGSLFALEVILGHFSNRYLGMVVTAAVSSNLVTRLLLGENRMFEIPVHRLHSILELPFYVILAIVCGFGAVFFIHSLYRTSELMQRLLPQLPFRAAAGLSVSGVFALFVPGVLGFNLHFLEQFIAADAMMPILAIVALFFIKLIVTSYTLGSGNAGGLFAPVLFMGAMLGGIVGQLGQMLVPAIVVDTGAFAVVGMAAMLSASVHAPISSILIIVEMSSDYHLIVPLLIAVEISTLIADTLQPDSIYTRKLTLRGIYLQRAQEIDLLQMVQVDEVMTINYPEVKPDTRLTEVMTLFEHTHHHGFPIVDVSRHFRGMVTISDAEQAKTIGLPLDTVVMEFATTTDLTYVYPDDPVYVALRHMNAYHIGRIVVVSREREGVYMGIIRREGILRAYEIALSRRSSLRHRIEHLKLREFERSCFMEIQVVPDAPMDGKVLAEFPYSDNCLLVSIRRGGEIMIAKGGTRLRAGDLVTAYTNTEYREAVRAQFASVSIIDPLQPVPAP